MDLSSWTRSSGGKRLRDIDLGDAVGCQFQPYLAAACRVYTTAAAGRRPCASVWPGYRSILFESEPNSRGLKPRVSP